MCVYEDTNDEYYNINMRHDIIIVIMREHLERKSFRLQTVYA